MNNDLRFHNEASTIEAFKQKYPKLSKIVELAINWGFEVEYDIDDAKQVLSWYNNNLQTHIKAEMGYNNANILELPFIVELKNGDLNTITLCDYIISVIGDIPIEAACCSPFLFRTSFAEYTMDKDFKISKWRYSISEYDRLLSNGEKYTDVLKEILVDINTRNELIKNYNATDSDLIELYTQLQQLTNSSKTGWQILKALEQSDLFNNVYCGSLMDFLLDKGKKEYMEIIEILY